MHPVLCHLNRCSSAASGISHVPAAVFGGNRYRLYHRHLCHYHLLRRFHHRETGGKPQVPVGTACRKHLLYHPVNSVHDHENAGRSVHHAHPDRARALCRRRHVRRHVKLNPAFYANPAICENGSFCFLAKRKDSQEFLTYNGKSCCPFLSSLINNPLVVRLLSGYYLIIARLLLGYFKS